MTVTDAAAETLLEFPCDFPVKAFGLSGGDFPKIVLDIVQRHAPGVSPAALSSRPSTGGKYQSVTVTLRAESKAQLDALYQDLTAHPEVIMAL
jgi:hypothetical protein